MTDPIMAAMASAVTAGREGDVESARSQLTALWVEVGVTGDALHRCSVAHYLADLYPDDPAQALVWDVRALDAADAVTQSRADDHHAGLQIAAFYPSLHLNLADNLRRLGSFAAAAEQVERARERIGTLGDDPYGHLIRTSLGAVAQRIDAQDTATLPTP